MHAEADLYELQFLGLRSIHFQLDAALGAVVDVPTAQAAGAFLLAHHHVESTALFPGLRRRGRLRSTDVAFLEACDRDHRDLHALCDALVAATVPATVVRLAGETRARLGAHVEDEERGLAPARLRTMIDPAGFAELVEELEALRRG